MKFDFQVLGRVQIKLHEGHEFLEKWYDLDAIGKLLDYCDTKSIDLDEIRDGKEWGFDDNWDMRCAVTGLCELEVFYHYEDEVYWEGGQFYAFKAYVETLRQKQAVVSTGAFPLSVVVEEAYIKHG